MKRFCKRFFFISFLHFSFMGIVMAQLTTLPLGGNKKASIREQVGTTEVTINYNRPGVKKREGHIWGDVIPAGYFDQGFGTSKAAPWRAGANENTTIEFSTDVKIEGQILPAGIYGFFVAYEPNECTLIFSKNSTSWGSFYYDPTEDALRVQVKPRKTDNSVEWLKYEFADQTPGSATIQLQWERLIIPFKVDVDLVTTQIASFRKELRSYKGFKWENWNQAAAYCAQNKINLNEALLWADSATSVNFGGNLFFQSWYTKANVLDSLGHRLEAAAAIKKGLPFASVSELYTYSRLLIHKKENQEAFELFKMSYDKSPDQFLTNMGMARGYSALGNYKRALTFAEKAQSQAPNKLNKDVVDKAIKALQDGKDMNN